MTEHEYEEWFDKNLGEIESLDKADINNSPFAYVPRPLRRKRWVIICIAGLSISLCASFILSLLYEIHCLWILNWCSNAFLNLAFGLTASIIILGYTNLRDKNVAFYSDILPKMENQTEKMKHAYREYSLNIDIEYQKKDFKKCYEAWHINSNTCFVILEYLRFLNTVLPPDLKSVLLQEDDIKKAEDQLLSANSIIQHEFFIQNTISEETVKKCTMAANCGMNALWRLDQLVITIKQGLYGLKYNMTQNKALKDVENGDIDTI